MIIVNNPLIVIVIIIESPEVHNWESKGTEPTVQRYRMRARKPIPSFTLQIQTERMRGYSHSHCMSSKSGTVRTQPPTLICIASSNNYKECSPSKTLHSTCWHIPASLKSGLYKLAALVTSQAWWRFCSYLGSLVCVLFCFFVPISVGCYVSRRWKWALWP